MSLLQKVFCRLCYTYWNINCANKIVCSVCRLMSNIIKATQGGSLSQICPQLLYYYHKQSNGRHFPTYRDVVFLTMVAAGRESVEACKSQETKPFAYHLSSHVRVYCIWGLQCHAMPCRGLVMFMEC